MIPGDRELFPPQKKIVAARVLSIVFSRAYPNTAPNKGKNPTAEGFMRLEKQSRTMYFC